MAAGDFLEVYTEKGSIHYTCTLSLTMGIMLWVRTTVIRHHTISRRASEMVTTSTTIIFVLFDRLQAPTILMISLYYLIRHCYLPILALYNTAS